MANPTKDFSRWKTKDLVSKRDGIKEYYPKVVSELAEIGEEHPNYPGLLAHKQELEQEFIAIDKELESRSDYKRDLSFTAHDDATSDGCVMCGNEWKSLNKDGYCSSCWTIWNS